MFSRFLSTAPGATPSSRLLRTAIDQVACTTAGAIACNRAVICVQPLGPPNSSRTLWVNPRAMILGCDEEVASARQYLDPSKADAVTQWSSSNIFTDGEKSCLRFTEEFIIDVSSIPDASASAVHEYLGEEGFVTFVNALLVVEQRIRLLLVWSKLVGSTGI